VVIKEEISKKEEGFRSLCQKHNVKFLYAFGSATGEDFDYQAVILIYWLKLMSLILLKEVRN